MRKSTQRWIGVGVFIAVLFFFGALLVMWMTDDMVEETPGQDQPSDADRLHVAVESEAGRRMTAGAGADRGCSVAVSVG